jgi:COP9 signalosome complex subunit 6
MLKLHFKVKDVHKSPALDLVGWFTLGPSTGPSEHHLPIHTRLQEVYNESPILLLFHPADAVAEFSAGGKLPLTLYESVFDSGPGMDIDGAGQHWPLKFRELVYTVETGEAEMISVDFVARGGGNATAIDSTKAAAAAPKAAAEMAEESKKGKGKAKDAAAAAKEGTIDESAVLTAEDEERECSPYTPFTCQTHPSNPPAHPTFHIQKRRS